MELATCRDCGGEFPADELSRMGRCAACEKDAAEWRLEECAHDAEMDGLRR